MVDFLEMLGGHVGPHPTENCDFGELFEYLHSLLWVPELCEPETFSVKTDRNNHFSG